MAVIVRTADPRSFVALINAAITAGRVKTWIRDPDGDYTHFANQWEFKAWMRASVGDGSVTFNIIGSQKFKMTREIYAVYHGRFIEMLLAHFDENFESAQATALPSVHDSIG